MTNNLPTTIPSDNEFLVLQVLARNAAASGLYAGVGSEQKILMILLAARELGIGPMMALNGGIWNIQGKIELSARLMSSMIRRAGHSLVIKNISDTECTLAGKRSDTGDSFSSTFTIKDAEKAGLIRAGGNWVKYAQDMLYARALSRLARRLFSDIIGNAYVEGEIKDAKCEIIQTINISEPEKVEEKLTPESEEEKLVKFLSSYEKEVQDMMRMYILKYSNHHKMSLTNSIKDFETDKEKFESDFNKWKKKELEKSQKS